MDVEPQAISRQESTEIPKIVPTLEEDDVEAAWMDIVAQAWHDELSDPREDIYTFEDGLPIDISQ